MLALYYGFVQNSNRQEIQEIIQGLLDILANRPPEIKPRDDFQEKHPNYRNFTVDPQPPLTEPPVEPTAYWKDRQQQYQQTHGRPLAPVKRRGPSTRVPEKATCLYCQAPAPTLYFNDGKVPTMSG